MTCLRNNFQDSVNETILHGPASTHKPHDKNAKRAEEAASRLPRPPTSFQRPDSPSWCTARGAGTGGLTGSLLGTILVHFPTKGIRLGSVLSSSLCALASMSLHSLPWHVCWPVDGSERYRGPPLTGARPLFSISMSLFYGGAGIRSPAKTKRRPP
jgi:hypothetical protein